MSQVAETLLETILEAWTGFVAHLPYLMVGALVILVTWGLSALTSRALGRVLTPLLGRGGLRLQGHLREQHQLA